MKYVDVDTGAEVPVAEVKEIAKGLFFRVQVVKTNRAKEVIKDGMPTYEVEEIDVEMPIARVCEEGKRGW